MFRRMRMALERRRAQAFLESSHGWRAVCDGIIETCGQALGGEGFQQGEIGVSLDKADRLLFQLRDYSSELRRLLRREQPDLEPRLKRTTDRVYELRNQTASFLIRSQGPDPLAGAPRQAPAERLYYDRAMQEVGFDARQLHTEVQGEFQATWGELERLIARRGLEEKAGV